MNANKSVTAHFKPDVTLTLVKQGVGELNPEEGVHTYIRDETESVVASPASGFDHWEGDLEENDDPNNPMQIVDNEGTDPRRFPMGGQLPAVFIGPFSRSRWPPQRGPVPGEQGKSLERSRAGPLHPRGHAAALT